MDLREARHEHGIMERIIANTSFESLELRLHLGLGLGFHQGVVMKMKICNKLGVV